MQDTLFEGVPEHLVGSLAKWITGYLQDRPALTERVALQMRVHLEVPDPQQLVDSVRADDSSRVLDVADTAIHLDGRLRWDLDVAGPEDNSMEASLADWIPIYRWPKGRQRGSGGATRPATGGCRVSVHDQLA